MGDFKRKLYDNLACAGGAVLVGVIICVVLQTANREQSQKDVDAFRKTLPNYRDSLATFDAKNNDSLMRWSDVLSRGRAGVNNLAVRDSLVKKCLQRTALIKKQKEVDARVVAYRDSIYHARGVSR